MTDWANRLKETKKCDKTITAANHGQLKAVARGTAEVGVTEREPEGPSELKIYYMSQD